MYTDTFWGSKMKGETKFHMLHAGTFTNMCGVITTECMVITLSLSPSFGGKHPIRKVPIS